MEHSATTLERLTVAIAAGDADEIQRLAHGLKGSAAAVGALQVANLSHHFCNSATGSPPERVEALRAELESSVAATRSVLER